MSGRIHLRVASGPRDGMGHAMRSLAVASELRELGALVTFVVEDPVAGAFLERAGFGTSPAEGHTYREADVVWFDGQRDWTHDLWACREAEAKGVLVENRTPAREHCDLLIYPALHYEPDDWDRRHKRRVIGGSQWIPLSRAVRQTKPVDPPTVDWLITFGGSDPQRLTEWTLSALAGYSGRTVVAVGAHMADRHAAIERLAVDLGDAEVLAPGTNLAPWMATSARAVTALGTTLYELAYLGVPATILANYATDRPALAYYDRLGPHASLGVFDPGQAALFRERLRTLVEAPVPRRIPMVSIRDGAPRLARKLIDLASERRSAA